MRKIVLASASPQRRKLLKLLGIPFSIHPSRTEEISKISTSCADLVKHNALLKARSVAKEYADAIVIGSDTLVYLGGKKIIGKPKDLAEAKRNLKKLSSQPHWVLTGVALIDTKTKKVLVDYEETKLFMNPLTSREIDQYYQNFDPLDKAGGFDIEGKASSFFRRIEGCYSNVIGLPLAKLRLMLKKMGVVLALILSVNFFAGCSSEYNLATHQEESLIYGTDKEVKIGEAVAQQIEQHYKMDDDYELNRRLSKILRSIADVSDRKELLFTIKVIDEDELNAVSLPGGFIYIFKGLTDRLKTDDELAAVIGHEVGHVSARHSIKRMQASMGYAVLQVMAVQSGNAQFASAVSAAYASVFLSYSRADEFQADELGVKYLKKAGYDPESMRKVLEVLKNQERKNPLRPLNYWRTHPYLSERMGKVNGVINGSIGFKDYLNITGNE